MKNIQVKSYENKDSKHVILDKNYKQFVSEFLVDQSTKSNKSNVQLYLTLLYSNIIKNNKLISKKDSSLLINNLTLHDIMKFQNHIESQVISRNISKEDAQEIVNTIYRFLKFLYSKNLVKIFYKPLNFISNDKTYSSNTILPILLEFEHYLTQKNYTFIDRYLVSVKRFLNFSHFNTNSNNSDFWKENIIKYELYLTNKVQKELLSQATAYQYLKRIKVFLDFLYEEKNTHFEYTIPPKMKNHGKRSNEYVNVKDILLVIDIIIETSRDILRDLTIYLIMVETGCRSIEIVNLTVNDISLKDRTIKLKCKKSEERTLKISDTLCAIIADYLIIRRNYLPKDQTTSLYLNSIGMSINTQTISKIIRKYNLKAFTTIIFSAKTLRHTFITNALNSNNPLEKVAETVGHKSLKTTLYYYYRETNILKKIANQKSLNWQEES